MKAYILALDQGTTSSRAILFDRMQNMIGMAQRELPQIYPREGWVEQNPMEIFASQYSVMIEVLAKTGVQPEEIAGIGITNQRETTILWDKNTGKPIYNAIVWQCRRTAEICEKLKRAGLSDYIQQNTGLIIDAYFSATKIRWILDHVEGAQERAERGEILFGTVDSWLIWKLTNGKVHITDYTNASRTMLYNINTLQWDEKLLKALNIPSCILPEVRNSSEIYGYLKLGKQDIPIAGAAGDQQAALFGQTCFAKGEVKNTYGTGCFLLMNTGKNLFRSRNGLLSTIAIGLEGKVTYAIEGSIFVAGAVIQWLRDEMRLITEAQDSEYFASKVPDSGGVFLVPAFTGLGAPYWDMYARGSIIGITRGTNRNHIIRAALESIAYQVKDIIDAVSQDTGIHLSSLRVDGGASANNFLMQFQADILGCEVIRPKIAETTALGAAYLAGLATGFWESPDQIKKLWTQDQKYLPQMEPEVRKDRLEQWHRAVSRCGGWLKDESWENKR